MRPRDLFGVALRVLGVWFLYDACYAGLRLAMLLLAMKEADLQQVSMTQDKFLVGFYLALAFVLLVLTDRIVTLCYGPDRT